MKISIRYKLLLGFISIALLTMPIIIYTTISAYRIEKDFSNIVDSALPRLLALMEMTNSAVHIEGFINNLDNEIQNATTTESTPTKIGATKDKLLAYLGEIDTWQKEYQNHVDEKSVSTTLDVQALKKARDAIIFSSLEIFSDKEKGVPEAQLVGKKQELTRLQLGLDNLIENAVMAESSNLEKLKEKTVNATMQLYNISLWVYSIILLTAIILSLFIARAISKPIIQLKNFAASINQDNLDERATITTHDEIGELVTSFNHMLDDLYAAKTQLIETSRMAGVAEMATGVLHNIGNILNSINTSTVLIIETVQKSKAVEVNQLVQLFQEHSQDLNSYLTNDKRGKLLLPYLEALGKNLEKEKVTVQEELKQLSRNLEHIKRVVEMQQSLTLGKSSGVIEKIVPADLLKDIVALQANEIRKSNINLEQRYTETSSILTVKAKIQQILVNLVKNAIESLSESEIKDKRLIIKIEKKDENFLQIIVADNGKGIIKEDLVKIFTFGFTTKQDGHGYGLHNSALLATELGGSLRAESAGPGQGAFFILEIPFRLRDAKSPPQPVVSTEDKADIVER